VINELKRQYRFIDLLKPEVEALLPIVAAMKPDAIGLMGRLARVARLQLAANRHRQKRPGWPDLAGDMSSSGLLTPEQDDAVDVSGDMTSQRPEESRLVAALVDGDVSDTTLDYLQKALRRWAQSTSAFDITQEDAKYLDAAGTLVASGRFDCVVYGHTHLPKRVISENGKWTYLNSGTWCDLLRVPDEVFGEDEHARDSLRRFLGALRANCLQPYRIRPQTYARVSLDETGAVTAARLCSFKSSSQPEVDVSDATLRPDPAASNE
jgi:predicted phosphodiesterase